MFYVFWVNKSFSFSLFFEFVSFVCFRNNDSTQSVLKCRAKILLILGDSKFSVMFFRRLLVDFRWAISAFIWRLSWRLRLSRDYLNNSRLSNYMDEKLNRGQKSWTFFDFFFAHPVFLIIWRRICQFWSCRFIFYGC